MRMLETIMPAQGTQLGNVKPSNNNNLCRATTTTAAAIDFISIQRFLLTALFLKSERLKLKLRVFLAGHSVAMVTYWVMKMLSTCSSVIGQFFDAKIVHVASTDKEWL